MFVGAPVRCGGADGRTDGGFVSLRFGEVTSEMTTCPRGDLLLSDAFGWVWL